MSIGLYSSAEYWEERYEGQKECFDWYFDWREYFEDNIGKLGIQAPVLIVGCGNSDMSIKIEEQGIMPVVSIDISKVVCEFMAEKTNGGAYVPMDVCCLQFRDECFECVIDKGTLDAILCDPCYPRLVTKMMKEIARVLAVGGLFIEITLADACERRKLLEQPDLLPWELQKAQRINGEFCQANIFVFKKTSKFTAKDSTKLLYLKSEDEEL